MIDAKTNRGQPLVALGTILGGWVLMRAMFWDAAALPDYQDEEFPDFIGAMKPGGSPVPVAAESRSDVQPVLRSPLSRTSEAANATLGVDPEKSWRRNPVAPEAPVAGPEIQQGGSTSLPVPFIAPPPVPVKVAATHQMLWMAALSRVPIPMAVLDPASYAKVPAPFYEASRRHFPSAKRWSGDGWLLLRRGGSARVATGAAPATYGASQAGAVIRYRLDPGSRHRPEAYLRVGCLGRGA